MQQLALVLGSKVDLLPLSFKETICGATSFLAILLGVEPEDSHLLANLLFGEEHTMPICRSLESLSVSNCGSVLSSTATLSSIFLLRHLPQLQKLAVKLNTQDLHHRSTGFAIYGLDIFYESDPEIVAEGNEIHEVTQNGQHLKWTLNSSFPHK